MPRRNLGLLTLGERWPDLLSVYDDAIENELDPSRKVTLLNEAARAAKDFAGNTTRANDYLKAIVFITPEDTKLATALQRRLEQQGRHADLIDMWQARLPILTGVERLECYESISARYLMHIGDSSASLEITETLLSLEDGTETAIKLLESIGAHSGAKPTDRRKSFAKLEELYEQKEATDDTIRVLLESLELHDDNADRLHLHRRVAEWLELSERNQEALEHWAALLRIAPTAEDAHQHLLDLGNVPECALLMVDALVAAAETASEVALRIQLLSEAAEAAALHLKDVERAIQLYSLVVQREDAEATARVSAATKLSSLLESTGRSSELLDTLELQSKLESDPDEKLVIISKAATLASSLNEFERSLTLWGARLAISEGDIPALDATVQILEQTNDYARLVEALLERAKNQTELARRTDLTAAADVYEHSLGNSLEATKLWQAIREQFGLDQEITSRLGSLLSRDSKFENLIELLEESIGLEKDPERLTSQYSDLGELYRDHRQDAQQATELFASALQISPSDVRSRHGLISLLDSTAGQDAVEHLASAYQASDEWQGLLELVPQRIQAASDKDKENAILSEAAHIAETRAQDHQQALSHLCRAFANSASPELESDLLRLAGLTDQFATAAAAYLNTIAACQEVERKVSLELALGYLLEQHLGELSNALDAYERVLQLDPQNTEGASRLISAASKIQRFDRAASTLVEVTNRDISLFEELTSTFGTAAKESSSWDIALQELVQSAERVADNAELSHHLFEICGSWYRDELSLTAQAISCFEQATKAVASPETLTALADLQRPSPDAAFVATLCQLADASDSALEPLGEAARVCLNVLQDDLALAPILERLQTVAFERLDGSLGGLPREESEWVLQQRVELFLKSGNASKAKDLLVKAADVKFDEAYQLKILQQAALLAHHELQVSDEAIALCQRILEIQEQYEETITLLAELYENCSKFQELRELREAELKRSPPLERALFLRLELSKILGHLGKSTKERSKILRKNLKDAPGHEASIRGLGQVLREARELTDLHTLFVDQATATEATNPSLSARLWARAGHTALQDLGDADAAADAYQHSVGIEANTEVLEGLALLCSSREEFANAVSWLEQLLQLLPANEENTAQRTKTRLDLAQALLKIKKEGEARRCLANGISEDPTALELRQLLAELYETAELWSDLAPLLESGNLHSTDPETRVVFLRQAAEVRRFKLNELERALPLLAEAHQLAPEDRNLHLFYADSLRLSERYSDARELLDTLLLNFGRRRTPEKATVHYHLARIAQAEGKLAEAIEQLEAASSIRRTDIVILKALGDVSQLQGDLDSAERAYRALLLVIGREESLTDVFNENSVGSSTVLLELSQIAKLRDDNERSQELLQSAIEAANEDPAESIKLEDALRDKQEWELVLRLLSSRELVTKDENARAKLLASKADVLVQTGQSEASLPLRLEALELNPSSRRLRIAATELARTLGRLELLSQTMLRVASHVEEDNAELACTYWLELGALSEEVHGPTSEASEFYERAQRTGSAPLESIEALNRVLNATGDTEALQSALERFIGEAESIAPPELFTESLYRLAEIELAHSKSAEDGLTRLELAIERSSNYPRAATALARSFDKVSASSAAVTLFERTARQSQDKSLLLEALLLSTKNDEIDFYVVQEAIDLAKELSDETAQLSLLNRAAEIQEKEGSLADNLWVLTDQIPLLHKRNPKSAIQLLTEIIPEANPLEQFDLKLQLAAMYLQADSESDKALLLLENLAETEPGNAKVWQPLVRLYRASGATEKVIQLLDSAEASVFSTEDRIILRLERIRLMMLDNLLEDAETALGDLLSEDPANPEATMLLIDILEKAERHEELQSLLMTQWESALSLGSKELVPSLAIRLASSQSSELAMDTFERSLEWSKESPEFINAVLAHDALTLRPHLQAEVLEVYVSICSEDDVSSIVSTLRQVRNQLFDLDGEIRALELGCSRLPSDQALQQELLQALRDGNRFEQLAETLFQVSANAENIETKLSVLLEAAQIYESDLGDPLRAVEALKTAASLAPLDTTIQIRLATNLERSGEIANAVACLTAVLEHDRLPSDSRSEVLHARAALVARNNPQDASSLASAIADIDEALALEAQQEILRIDVEELLSEDLIAILLAQHALALSESDDVVARDSMLRLFTILPDANRTQEALELLVAWVKQHGDDADAVSALGQLAMRLERWAAATKAYARLVDLTSGEQQRNAALVLAEVSAKSGEPSAAQSALEKVFQANPGDAEVLGLLRAIYEAAGAYAELAHLILGQLNQSEDEQHRFDCLIQAGDLLSRSPDHLDEAISLIEEARQLKPDEIDVITTLAGAYSRANRFDEASSLLTAAIEAHGNRRTPELSRLQFAVAQLAHLAGDPRAELEWLDAALQSDRQNGEIAAQLAVLAMDHSEWDIAIKALQLVTVSKSQGPMSRAEAYLRQGIIARAQGDSRKAIIHVKRALAAEPDYAAAQQQLAELEG